MGMNIGQLLYMEHTFSLYPSSGTGVPHFRSREIHLGFSPSLIQDFVIILAFDVQIPVSNALSRCLLSSGSNYMQQNI